MGLAEDIEEMQAINDDVDRIVRERDAARRRLGQYQALAVQWITSVAQKNQDEAWQCLNSFSQMLREDLCPANWAPSRIADEALARAFAAEKRAQELQAANDALRSNMAEASRENDALREEVAIFGD